MNKNKFRVIYNRTLSQFVVVSELVKNSDKSSRIKKVSAESVVDFERVLPLTVNSSILIKCDININSEAAQLEADKRLALLAENNITLGTATTTSNVDEYHKYKSGSSVAKTTKTTYSSQAGETEQGSQLSGNEVTVIAGKDIHATATTGEATAMMISEKLYDKPADKLTEDEKKNVVFLSQVASGLVSSLVANDGAASTAVGSEIGKRAVENNAVTPETAWDVANIAIGVTSLVHNINEGNYGSAAIDAAGLAYDSIATVIPFLPAGVSAGLEAYRVGNTAMQSATIGSDVAKAIKAADKAAKDPANIVKNAAVTGTKIHRAT
ncbi:MAG: VENN motif pre-toxin domain-containing protein [[Pasteurella] aerogenes]|nr:VENN motif pre-toxin domain-containing protein [[Pasteurella] aerogenes]